ncbi:MAG: nitrite/sulfite reductase [Bryobacteraceae bacterium]|nr:nitrite/sulfite reductase [Bryobacteraceae bacterium]
MKASNPLWKDRLGDHIAPDLGAEIDAFESEIALKKQGKIDDKIFAETRLRRGAYGQRYDNGQRHDGIESRKLAYPREGLTKGPNTLWNAPGMQRIKIPFGGLNASQLEVMAELAEEYSDGIAHVTTRQDFQLHYVHIEDAPSLMRRLAAVGITTREACGNTVRNVTACPLAGVCRGQSFDVTPYAKAFAYFMLGHPDTQDFGRKFKATFSGCADEPCGLVRIHDIGCVAKTREVDGKLERGFTVYVGGGLGTVPYQAKLFDEFVPDSELLPLGQAMARVFARLGEKKNRNAARMKFLVVKLGLEEFKRLVLEERAGLPFDPRWTAYLAGIDKDQETPSRPPGLLQIGPAEPADQREWRASNVYPQRQAGYATVTVVLPLGDITADQLRALATIARKFVNETVRTTVEQNIVLRWVSESDLPALYDDLKRAGLNQAGAGTLLDPTSCPGTDTCKLGISSSRGLAGELRMRLAESAVARDEAVRNLRIKVSGCFNSCGQHHIADLGFYGVSRNKSGYAAPHFQVILGGQWTENGGAYGLAIGAVPSKRVPEAVERILRRYLDERQGAESFQTFIRRIGKVECKRMLEDLMELPSHAEDASLYTDWHDVREYTLGDMGVGECAGAVVSPLEFQLTACEREAFEAQVALEKGDIGKAAQLAYGAMLRGATALLAWRQVMFVNSPGGVVEAFRKEFYDTQLFFDPFAGGKFAQYFFRAHERAAEERTAESATRLIEEAQLFIEACHGCTIREAARLQAAKV